MTEYREFAERLTEAQLELMQEAILLAVAFHKLVREALAEHLEEIDRRNAAIENKNVCATHDFCDANMLMDEAFTERTGHEVDAEDKDDTLLWSAAWTIAAGHGFSKPWLQS